MKISCLRRAGGAWALALLGISSSLLFPAALRGSSHREAPLISDDPAADNTDVYMFRDPLDPSRIVMIANWIPLEEPAGGPNFFHFSEGIRYEFNIDNTGDGVEDITYRFLFTRTVRRGNTFLQNSGPVDSPASDALNVFYTYSVDRVIGSSGNAPSPTTRLGSGLLEAPNNVGPKSFPGTPPGSGYGKGSRIETTIATIDGDIRVFAGPRAEGFYVDLGMVFDLVNFRPGTLPGNIGGGKNETAGYNVHTIALSVPIQKLTRNASVPTSVTDPNAIIGMWSSTWRRTTRILSSTGAKPLETGDWVQVSRLGLPLVNEVVIPIGMKDLFNASHPKDDIQFGAFVLDPELPKALKALFNIDSPPAPRMDLLVLVQGIPGLTRRPGEVISDQLRLNVAVPPTPIFAVNRLGVLGGDLAGFPNGRRPYDDTVDIALRVVAGVLVPAFNRPPNNQLGDGVDGPDRPFIAGFPYLWTPHSGWDHRHDGVPVFTQFDLQPVN